MQLTDHVGELLKNEILGAGKRVGIGRVGSYRTLRTLTQSSNHLLLAFRRRTEGTVRVEGCPGGAAGPGDPGEALQRLRFVIM